MRSFWIRVVPLLLLALPMPAAAKNTVIQQAILQSVDTVILPAFQSFEARTIEHRQKIAALCQSPGENTLLEAREGFASLVRTFSRIEMFRFGPLTVEHRIERLFFWPDRKGRALKQISKILSTRDETATTFETLQGKSVAVQGLPALEYLLFGKDSTLLTTQEGDFRCRYATAIADVLADIAAETARDWADPQGFRTALLAPHPDAAIYRTEEEAMQELVKAARAQLQAISELKLSAALRDSLEKAKPKRLPFWRSGLALQALAENLTGVQNLIEAWPLAEILGQNEAIAGQITFELDQARRAIHRVEDAMEGPLTGETLIAHIATADPYKYLSYARLPTISVTQLLTEEIAVAMGLTIGFNAMDGD